MGGPLRPSVAAVVQGDHAAAIALPALFARFPDLELAEPADALEPLPTPVFNAKARVPVRL
ncbi:hypothetical protein ACIP98_18560 [Streptomyces sp. NPDC088354]|uniref:hypothetical protein n=1 Tax=Streptomyces sp. NPDC088354 TaxID=3365856 RepID=UPI0037FE05CC